MHHHNQLTVVDDTYNANPESARAGLSSLQKAFPDRKKTLILGDMLELGETSAEDHCALGVFAAKTAHPTRLICVGGEAEQIAKGARSVNPEIAISTYGDTSSLLADQNANITDSELVYLKASNGIKLTLVVDHLLGSS